MSHPQRTDPDLVGGTWARVVSPALGRARFLRVVLLAVWIGTAVRPPIVGAASAADALPVLPSRSGSALEGASRPAPDPRSRRALDSATATPTLLQQLAQQLDAAWNAQDWPLAITLVERMIALDPNYDDIQAKHYFAYVNWGYQLLTNGQCVDAQAKFRRALELRPNGEEALAGLDLAARYCVTPTPGPTATPPAAATATVVPPGAPTLTPTPQALAGPISYTVQAGDTVYSLARRYGTTVQAIMQANGMMDYSLRTGMVIVIPTGAAPAPGPLVHIVQPGETLNEIARHYNTTVWAIMAMNSMGSPTIWAYRALFIPSAAEWGPIMHIVMPGETLNAIAKHWATTVPLIMLANNLTDYDIYVYQRLIIPPQGWNGWPPLVPGMGAGGQPLHPKTYVVQPGDTLYSISRRFGVTVAALRAANSLSDNDIASGQTLRIP